VESDDYYDRGSLGAGAYLPGCGILAIGANIFNMAVVGVFVANGVYHAIQRLLSGNQKVFWLSGFIAAWASIVVASFSCALQLALSGTSPASIAVPAMVGVHALIGIGEGLITVAALAFLYATRRDLISGGVSSSQSTRSLWSGGSIMLPSWLSFHRLPPLQMDWNGG
jgi:cobalt/nickel transport system permease protein